MNAKSIVKKFRFWVLFGIETLLNPVKDKQTLQLHLNIYTAK